MCPSTRKSTPSATPSTSWAAATTSSTRPTIRTSTPNSPIRPTPSSRCRSATRTSARSSGTIARTCTRWRSPFSTPKEQAMKSISPVLQAVAAMLLLAACGAGAAPASSPVTTSPAASTAKPAASAPANAAAPASVSAKPAASSAASAKPAASGATTGAAIAVKVSNPSPAASMLPYYAALSQGFFKDQGLDVTVVQRASPVAITALSKDEVQFMTVPSDAVTGVTKGLPDRIVYLLWDKAPWVVIGKTSINSLSDLKGKTIAIHPAGSS